MRFPVGPVPNGACGDKNVVGIAFLGADGEYLKEVPDRGKDGKEPAGIHSQPLCAEDYAAVEKKGARMALIVEPKLSAGMVCHAKSRGTAARYETPAQPTKR